MTKIQRRKLSHGGLKLPGEQTGGTTAVGSGDLLGVRLGKIYDARRTKPTGNAFVKVLIFLDDVFGWYCGYYNSLEKKYCVPMFPDCATLYWTSMPPSSLRGIERLISR